MHSANGTLSAVVSCAKLDTLYYSRVDKLFNYAIYFPDDIELAVYMRFYDAAHIAKAFQDRINLLQNTQVTRSINGLVYSRDVDLCYRKIRSQNSTHTFVSCRVIIGYTNGLFNARFAGDGVYTEESQALLRELVDIYRSVHWMGLNGFCSNVAVVFQRNIVRFTNAEEFMLQHRTNGGKDILVRLVLNSLSQILHRGAEHVRDMHLELAGVYEGRVATTINSRFFMARESLRLAVSMTHHSVHQYVKRVLVLPSVTDLQKQLAKAAILHVEDLHCVVCADLYSQLCSDANINFTDETAKAHYLAEGATYMLQLLQTLNKNNDVLSRTITLTAGHEIDRNHSDFDILHELYAARIDRKLGEDRPFMSRKVGANDLHALYAAAGRDIPIDVFIAPSLLHIRGLDTWPTICSDPYCRDTHIEAANTTSSCFEIIDTAKKINLFINSKDQQLAESLNISVSAMRYQYATLLHELKPSSRTDYDVLDIDLSLLEVVRAHNTVVLRPTKIGHAPTINTFNYFLHNGEEKDRNRIRRAVYNIFANVQKVLPTEEMNALLYKIDHYLNNNHYERKLLCVAQNYAKYVYTYSIVREMCAQQHASMPTIVNMPTMIHVIRHHLDDKDIAQILSQYVNFMTTYTVLCVLHNDTPRIMAVLSNMGDIFAVICEHIASQLHDSIMNYKIINEYLLLQDLICTLYAKLVICNDVNTMCVDAKQGDCGVIMQMEKQKILRNS